MMRTRSAQNLVEFALVVVLLLSLVLGILEFGRVWMSYQVVTNASREGARVAALPTGFSTAEEVTARVNAYMTSASMDAGQTTITVANEDGATGTDAVVTVTYNAQLLFLGPILKLIDSGSNLPGTIALTGTATMRNE